MTALLALIAFFIQGTFTPAIPLYAAPSDGAVFSFPEVSEVSVPESIAGIEEVFAGERKETVILVRDAHGIPEAQRSIRDLIDHFQKSYGLRTIAFEGAATRMNPRIFRSFPDGEILQEAFEEYLQSGELTGTAMAAIFNENESEYAGIEDWELYEEGYGLFLTAMEEGGEAVRRIEEQDEALKKKQEETYSKELLEVDRAVRTFRSDEGDLFGMLKVLAGVKAPEEGSELALLLEESRRAGEDSASLEMEVKRAAEEVERGLRALPAGEAAAKDLREFNERKQTFGLSALSVQQFALYLRDAAGRNGITLELSDELAREVGRQQRLRDLEGTVFFDSLEQYINEVENSLIRNEEQRALRDEGRFLDRLRRLASLELPYTQWEEILGDFEGGGKGEPYRELVDAHLAFYENAEARDEAFAERLAELFESRGDSAVLFVAGGFHTRGLVALLKEQGYSYVLVRPAITAIPEDIHYKDHMRGMVSWRDYYDTGADGIHVYEAFVRAARDRMLEAAGDDGAMLKAWRDEIIRDLAEDNRVEEAGRYTRFIDEMTDGPADAALLERIEKFGEGIRRLEAEGRLNQNTILELLHPASTIADQGAANLAEGSVFRNFRIVNGLWRRAFVRDEVVVSAKSELRTAAPERFRAARSLEIDVDPAFREASFGEHAIENFEEVLLSTLRKLMRRKSSARSLDREQEILAEAIAGKVPGWNGRILRLKAAPAGQAGLRYESNLIVTVETKAGEEVDVPFIFRVMPFSAFKSSQIKWPEWEQIEDEQLAADALMEEAPEEAAALTRLYFTYFSTEDVLKVRDAGALMTAFQLEEVKQGRAIEDVIGELLESGREDEAKALVLRTADLIFRLYANSVDDVELTTGPGNIQVNTDGQPFIPSGVPLEKERYEDRTLEVVGAVFRLAKRLNVELSSEDLLEQYTLSFGEEAESLLGYLAEGLSEYPEAAAALSPDGRLTPELVLEKRQAFLANAEPTGPLKRAAGFEFEIDPSLQDVALQGRRVTDIEAPLRRTLERFVDPFPRGADYQLQQTVLDTVSEWVPGWNGEVVRLKIEAPEDRQSRITTKLIFFIRAPSGDVLQIPFAFNLIAMLAPPNKTRAWLPNEVIFEEKKVSDRVKNMEPGFSSRFSTVYSQFYSQFETISIETDREKGEEQIYMTNYQLARWQEGVPLDEYVRERNEAGRPEDVRQTVMEAIGRMLQSQLILGFHAHFYDLGPDNILVEPSGVAVFRANFDHRPARAEDIEIVIADNIAKLLKRTGVELTEEEFMQAIGAMIGPSLSAVFLERLYGKMIEQMKKQGTWRTEPETDSARLIEVVPAGVPEAETARSELRAAALNNPRGLTELPFFQGGADEFQPGTPWFGDGRRYKVIADGRILDFGKETGARIRVAGPEWFESNGLPASTNGVLAQGIEGPEFVILRDYAGRPDTEAFRDLLLRLYSGSEEFKTADAALSADLLLQDFGQWQPGERTVFYEALTSAVRNVLRDVNRDTQLQYKEYGEGPVYDGLAFLTASAAVGISEEIRKLFGFPEGFPILFSGPDRTAGRAERIITMNEEIRPDRGGSGYVSIFGVPAMGLSWNPGDADFTREELLLQSGSAETILQRLLANLRLEPGVSRIIREFSGPAARSELRDETDQFALAEDFFIEVPQELGRVSKGRTVFDNADELIEDMIEQWFNEEPRFTQTRNLNMRKTFAEEIRKKARDWTGEVAGVSVEVYGENERRIQTRLVVEVRTGPGKTVEVPFMLRVFPVFSDETEDGIWLRESEYRREGDRRGVLYNELGPLLTDRQGREYRTAYQVLDWKRAETFDVRSELREDAADEAERVVDQASREVFTVLRKNGSSTPEERVSAATAATIVLNGELTTAEGLVGRLKELAEIPGSAGEALMSQDTYKRGIDYLLNILSGYLEDRALKGGFTLVLDLPSADDLSAYPDPVERLEQLIGRLVIRGEVKGEAAQALIETLGARLTRAVQLSRVQAAGGQIVIPQLSPAQIDELAGEQFFGVSLDLDGDVRDPRVRTYAALLQIVIGIMVASEIDDPAEAKLSGERLKEALGKPLALFQQYQDPSGGIFNFTSSGVSISVSRLAALLSSELFKTQVIEASA